MNEQLINALLVIGKILLWIIAGIITFIVMAKCGIDVGLPQNAEGSVAPVFYFYLMMVIFIWPLVIFAILLMYLVTLPSWLIGKLVLWILSLL